MNVSLNADRLLIRAAARSTRYLHVSFTAPAAPARCYSTPTWGTKPPPGLADLRISVGWPASRSGTDRTDTIFGVTSGWGLRSK